MSFPKNIRKEPPKMLQEIKNQLLDPLAKELIAQVHWINLIGLSRSNTEKYPIVISGNGPPILCLHGFDSSFLEFRRIYPLLAKDHKLIIPDLYGFGFCPRPQGDNYGISPIINHLNLLIDQLISNEQEIGVIGASMGGAIAMEIARRNQKKINKLLLLSPAGLTAEKSRIPWPLNHIGVNFLRQSCVRKQLCRLAFANPQESVGPAEEQIASIHLDVPGWGTSLAAFALNGGVANCAIPIPKQPLRILMGDKDRIIPKEEKIKMKELLKNDIKIIDNCGHLPHLEHPQFVARFWNNFK